MLARSALDCALLLTEMAGFDARDSTCLEMPREDFTADFHKPVQGQRIGPAEGILRPWHERRGAEPGRGRDRGL